jgi:hypothetical protein
MARAVLLQLAVTVQACALVTLNHAEPKTAAVSIEAEARPDSGVSEIITCNFDELDSASGAYVVLYVGSPGTDPSSRYELDACEVGGGVDPAASNQGSVASKNYTWLKMTLTVASGHSFTKSKKYEFRFTRSGTAQLNPTIRAVTLTSMDY